MIKTEVNITINEPGWDNYLPDNQELSRRVVEVACDYANQHNAINFFQLDKPLVINLCLSDDNEVHTLNRDFRNMDKPTNVLSFANIDSLGFDEECRLNDEIELGDIIIALETMQREAEEKGIALHDHYCHLLTHGVLHLLGFDHIEDNEAEYMESFEIEILKLLHINNPYQE